jgi:hypothetical protein
MTRSKPDDEKVRAAGRTVATAAQQYEGGRISREKFEEVLAKAQRVPGFMDLYDIDALARDREAKYQGELDNAQLLQFDGRWWSAVKKEAGIKSAKLFSDASVGKHIDRFNGSVQAWRRSGGGNGRLGDPGKLRSAIKEGEALKAAFAAFVRKKEFTSELAQQLRAKITQFDQQLDRILRAEKTALQAHLDQNERKKAELVSALKKAGLPF